VHRILAALLASPLLTSALAAAQAPAPRHRPANAGGTAVAAAPALPAPVIRAVYPRRIEVGTVLEIEGANFVAKGAAPTLTLRGHLADAEGIRPVTFQAKAVFESHRRIVYRFLYTDFEKLGKPRGELRGTIEVACPVPGFVLSSAPFPLRARLFPPTLKALGDEAVAAGVVPTINVVLTWALLGLLWLALTLVFVRVVMFGRDRARPPPRGSPPRDLFRYLVRRGTAAFVVLLLSGAVFGTAYAVAGPLSRILDALTGWPYAIHLGLAFLVAFVLVNFALLYAGPITWVERRVAARMQSRVGPNRVGPHGLLQWLADGFKAVMKEDIIPASADPVLFRAAPYLVFAAIFSTFAVLPFSATWSATDLNVGILFVISVTSIVVPGLMMAGWSSNNKWSLFGGMRAAAQIVSYEIPAALAVLSILIYTGSLSMQDIIRAQGGAPWNWFIFQNPFTFFAFFLFFISALAEGNRAPFDLPEAESELVSGYNTEYSGMRFLMFFVAEYVNIYVMSAIATTLFLGGWRVPLVSVAEQEVSIAWQLVGLLFFWLKVGILSFVVIWLRWTLPRLRVDQLMTMCWKYFVPLAFACFIGSAVWYMVFSEMVLVDKILRGVLFVAGLGIVAYLFYRAWWHFKHTKAEVYLNPLV
jgi:NADH:ubiquinone oxidoreductase subunit H